MLISQSFEVKQPIDAVWKFFDDIPQVAASIPGANLSKEITKDKYEGGVVVSAGVFSDNASPVVIGLPAAEHIPDTEIAGCIAGQANLKSMGSDAPGKAHQIRENKEARGHTSNLHFSPSFHGR